jgi:hypothetical protein
MKTILRLLSIALPLFAAIQARADDKLSTPSIPEPAIFALAGIGLAGFMGYRLLKK